MQISTATGHTQRARLAVQPNWPALWKTTDFFASPRDGITFEKVRHRNLCTPSNVAGENPRCIACGQLKENIVHYAECECITDQVWEPLLDLMHRMNLPVMEHQVTFLLTGARSAEKACSPAQLGMLKIMWRCVYAEMVAARIDKTRPNLRWAYRRGVRMIVSRLRAYGVKWRTWARKNERTTRKSVIPEKHRDKEILEQTEVGDYKIHDELWAEAQR